MLRYTYIALLVHHSDPLRLNVKLALLSFLSFLDSILCSLKEGGQAAEAISDGCLTKYNQT